MTAGWMVWPVMPAWAWPLSWAVVAAAVVVWLWPREVREHPATSAHAQRVQRPSRARRQIKGSVGWMGVTAGVVAWLAVWPQGGWSGYAALALQSPSLLTVTWALVCVSQATRGSMPAREDMPVPVVAWLVLCVLGWLLTIDTLNLWPRAWEVSFYAWGFSAGSLWLSAVLVLTLAWLRQGVWVWFCIAVLALFACLRWPSGNLWDAWLDPAVWIVAHVQVARHAWRASFSA